MIQAIFYKEWIKTRWYWLLATLFMIGITGYSMLRIGRTIAIQGIDHLWVVMVQKDGISCDPYHKKSCQQPIPTRFYPLYIKYGLYHISSI